MPRSAQSSASAQPFGAPAVEDWHIEVRSRGRGHRDQYQIKVRIAGIADAAWQNSFTREQFEHCLDTQTDIFEHPQRAEAVGKRLCDLLLVPSLHERLINCGRQSQTMVRLLLNLDAYLHEAPWECLRCDKLELYEMREWVSIVRVLPDLPQPAVEGQATRGTIIIAVNADQAEQDALSLRRLQRTRDAIITQLPGARVEHEAADDSLFRAELPKTARLAQDAMDQAQGHLLRVAARGLQGIAAPRTGLLALIGHLSPAVVASLMEDTRGEFALITLHRDATGPARGGLPKLLTQEMKRAAQSSARSPALDLVLGAARRSLYQRVIRARSYVSDAEKMLAYLPILWVSSPTILQRHLGWEQPVGELRVEAIAFPATGQAPISALAWHPEEQVLFAGTKQAAPTIQTYQISGASGEQQVRDISAWLSTEGGGHSDGIYALLPIPQTARASDAEPEPLVYSSSDDGTIRGWMWGNGPAIPERTRMWKVSCGITAMAMGPSGELALATTQSDLWLLRHHAQLWGPGVTAVEACLAQQCALSGAGQRASLTFAPQSEWLAAGLRSQAVQMWTVANGVLDRRVLLEAPGGDPVTSVMALSDRILLAGTAAGALRMWEASAVSAHTWTLKGSFEGHQRLVAALPTARGNAAEVQWLAHLDGMRLLLVVSPACASLWRFNEQEEIEQYPEWRWQPSASPGATEVEGVITTAAAHIAPTGAYIALGCEAGQIHLFHLRRGSNSAG